MLPCAVLCRPGDEDFNVDEEEEEEDGEAAGGGPGGVLGCCWKSYRRPDSVSACRRQEACVPSALSNIGPPPQHYCPMLLPCPSFDFPPNLL